MSEANTDDQVSRFPAGYIAAALGWTLAGLGGGMGASQWLIEGLSAQTWLWASGSVLMVGGIALGFYSHIQRGGLDAASTTDGAGIHLTSPGYFTALAGIATASAVFAIQAGLTMRADTGGTNGRQETIDVPGLSLTLPSVRNLKIVRDKRHADAMLVGPPSGPIEIDWHMAPNRLDTQELRAAATTMTRAWGTLERNEPLETAALSGGLFLYADGDRHTAIAQGQCRETLLSITVAVSTPVANASLNTGRAIAESVRCTGSSPRVPATDKLLPTFAMADDFGFIPLDGNAMFASLNGEALVFQRHTIAAVETLARDETALQQAFRGAAATIENWSKADWPIGHKTKQPLWSFTMSERRPDGSVKRKNAYVTTLLCSDVNVGFMVLALSEDKRVNLARLITVRCPLADKPPPTYETIEQVAKRLCDGGDAAACDALKQQSPQ